MGGFHRIITSRNHCAAFVALALGISSIGLSFAADNPTTRPLLAAATGLTPPATAPATAPAKTAEQKKQEDIARVMEFFRITQPDVYEQAKCLRDTEPAKFEKLIQGASSMVNRLEATRKRNPRLFDLQMKDIQMSYRSLKLAHEYQDAKLTPPQKAEKLKELQALVADEFEVQQQIRQAEWQELQAKVEELQKKVADLQQRVKDRETDKKKIVDKRIEDLTQREPKPEW